MSDFGNMEQRFDARNGGIVEFGSDARLFVEFYSRSVRDEVASKSADRPVHVQVDYVRIRQPGERDEINRPAHDGDRRRFSRHWQAYQEGRQATPDGTPLSILFPNNPEIVENLKYDKIFVVEQLAELNDTQIGNIGLGGRQFVDKAKAFLKAANSGRGFAQLTAKVDQMEADRAADKERIKALEMALTEANKKRGEAA
jgi:hypothetical protein